MAATFGVSVASALKWSQRLRETASATAPSPAIAVPLIAVSGMGYGFYQIPNVQALVTVVPVSRTSDVTAMGALSRTLGQATGAATVALLMRVDAVHATSEVLLLGGLLAVLAGVTSYMRGTANNDACQKREGF